MDHNRFDVIVVGGGPAGITAATALAKQGFSVLVCEAAVYPGAENWSGAVYFAENLEADDAFGKQAIEEGPFERRLIAWVFSLQRPLDARRYIARPFGVPLVFHRSAPGFRPLSC